MFYDEFFGGYVSSYGVDAAIQTTSAGVQPHSNVIATSTNNNLNVLGFWFVNSGVSYSDDVVVMRVAFNNFLFDSVDGMSVRDINMLSDTVADFQQDPLFYPAHFGFQIPIKKQVKLDLHCILQQQLQWIWKFICMIFWAPCLAKRVSHWKCVWAAWRKQN